MDLLTRLQKRGELSLQDTTMLQAFKTRWKVDCFHALLECKVYSEGRMAELIAEEFSFPCVDNLHPELIDASLCTLVPYHVARRLSALPLKINEQGCVQTVFANPSDESAVKTIASFLKQPMQVMVAQRTDIQVLISEMYTPEAMLNSQDI